MPDCLATPTGRKVLFGLLYLSEGAPIGFIWLGLPTRWRAADVPLEQITWLMALLIMPWTLKFLWAPLIDLVRGPYWSFKQWILASQLLMALSLIPLVWLDIQSQFTAVSIWLLFHACAAATQDIAIDALCIQQSAPAERGALNGWMQCGVLLGRALMGGGSLVLERWIGFTGVLGTLIAVILSSAILLSFARETPTTLVTDRDLSLPLRTTFTSRLRSMLRELATAVRSRGMWVGFLFALSAPAAFKSLEAVIGPFLIDHGYSQFEVGRFTATMMIGGMVVGALLAGRVAHGFASTAFVSFAVVLNLAAVSALGLLDLLAGGGSGLHLYAMLTAVAVTIGWFTVALYNWLMNLTSVRLAATQFTAFMAATNACEAWSTALMGVLHNSFGYPTAILILCSLSGLAALLILGLRPRVR